MRWEEVSFEQAVEKEDYATVAGRVYSMIANVGKGTMINRFVLQQVLQVCIGNILGLVLPA